MKTLLYTFLALLIMLSCATTKEAKSTRIQLKKEKQLAEQEMIGKSVESRRFIIKFDRIYFTRGGMADLIPQRNYMIIDGNKAIINAAYFGRQFDIRPIAGINMRGEAKDFELSSNSSKGFYEIALKVDNNSNSFNVYLKIGKNGSCSASLSSMMIDVVRYKGRIVPVAEKEKNPSQDSTLI